MVPYKCDEDGLNDGNGAIPCGILLFFCHVGLHSCQQQATGP